MANKLASNWKMEALSLSPFERVENHNRLFPNNPPMISTSRWMIGCWHFHRSRSGNFYGSYPDRYLRKVYSLFPDCYDILHLFSGSLTKEEKGLRFDISDKYQPDFVGDVKNINAILRERKFDLIIADPPYEEKDFVRYGTPIFNKKKVVLDICANVKPKGFLVWLDLIIPSFSNRNWKWMGMIGFSQGAGMRARCVTILQNNEGCS